MEEFLCLDADDRRVSPGPFVMLPYADTQCDFRLQSGISPPVLPCIQASLSPDLAAALVDNPDHAELMVSVIQLPLLRPSVLHL
jgi:hypothetical protein